MYDESYVDISIASIHKRKNDFAEILKNLARDKFENNFVIDCEHRKNSFIKVKI